MRRSNFSKANVVFMSAHVLIAFRRDVGLFEVNVRVKMLLKKLSQVPRSNSAPLQHAVGVNTFYALTIITKLSYMKLL